MSKIFNNYVNAKTLLCLCVCVCVCVCVCHLLVNICGIDVVCITGKRTDRSLHLLHTVAFISSEECSSCGQCAEPKY